jgi:ABC-type transport system involved in cytochrome c biogenesis permease subunit
MITADLINGLFELMAGFFVLNHCRILHAHKQVRGVSLTSSGFFLLWGVWNMYYYPALNQPLSFYGGVFVVVANAFYLGMMLRYRRAEALAEVFDEHQLYLGVESTGSFPVKEA